MVCINLRQEFGRQYRIQYEEGYYAEYGPNARVEDPVYMTIPCQYGHIYPAGPQELAASVDGFRKVAGRLKRLKCCRVHQDGDFGELTVLFDVADLPKVAKIMRPRRRRQVTLPAEQRQVIGERLREGRKQAQQAIAEKQYTEQGRVSVPRGDPKHVPTQRGLFDRCSPQQAGKHRADRRCHADAHEVKHE
jgi:hypothetical protein